jgi:hypothetical protein
MAGLRLLVVSFAAFGMSLAHAGAVRAQSHPVALPAPTGPHRVGTITFRWVDQAREESATADAGDRRQVIAQVRYPAAPMAEPVIAPYLPELGAMREAFSAREDSTSRRIAADLGVFADVRAHSLAAPAVDAPEGSQRYPIVVFSPGGNMSRHWHTALLEELASRGYVAVTISHPYVGLDVFPVGGLLESIDWGLDADDPAEARANEDRMADVLAGDVRFVLERLVALDASDPDGRFTGRLDLDRVGIVGHSRGGATVARSCSSLPAIDACVILDNIGTEREMETGLPRPHLAVRRADWSESRVARLRGFLGRNTVESWDVAIAGASHFSFSDLPIVDPTRYGSEIDPLRAHRIVADLVLAFLDQYVRGERSTSIPAAIEWWDEAARAAVSFSRWTPVGIVH